MSELTRNYKKIAFLFCTTAQPASPLPGAPSATERVLCRVLCGVSRVVVCAVGRNRRICTVLAFLMLIPTLFRKRFEAWEKAMAQPKPSAAAVPAIPLNGNGDGRGVGHSGGSVVPATPPAKVLGDSRTPNKLLLS
jgi:hypothetical protein